MFEKWGKPKSIRVDNGLPFVNPNTDVPTPLCLWLISIGVDVLQNRSCRPTDNAKVERMQSVTYRWAEPEKWTSLQELNKALESVCLIQREQYQCDQLNGKTRAQVYPRLLKGGKPYHPSDFNLDRVLTYLAKSIWARKASKKGIISFFSLLLNVGTKYKHQNLYIRLDPKNNQWIISQDHQGEIKRFTNTIITKENILNLSTNQRRDYYSAKENW